MCSLAPSGPIRLIRDHGVTIDNLVIRGTQLSNPDNPDSEYTALSCLDSRDVTLRNLRVEHEQWAVGILFDGCDNLRIENVEVVAGGGEVPNVDCDVSWQNCDNVLGRRSERVSLRDVQ